MNENQPVDVDYAGEPYKTVQTQSIQPALLAEAFITADDTQSRENLGEDVSAGNCSSSTASNPIREHPPQHEGRAIDKSEHRKEPPEGIGVPSAEMLPIHNSAQLTDVQEVRSRLVENLSPINEGVIQTKSETEPSHISAEPSTSAKIEAKRVPDEAAAHNKILHPKYAEASSIANENIMGTPSGAVRSPSITSQSPYKRELGADSEMDSIPEFSVDAAELQLLTNSNNLRSTEARTLKPVEAGYMDMEFNSDLALFPVKMELQPQSVPLDDTTKISLTALQPQEHDGARVSEQSARVENLPIEGIGAEFELDSSPIHTTSDDTDDENYEMLDPAELSRRLIQEDGGSDDEGGGKVGQGAKSGPLRTLNEKPEEAVPKPNVTITDDMNILEAGIVETLVENEISIAANASGEHQVLDAGTILCLEDRSVIGQIAETFGPVQRPYYIVRFTNAAAISEAGISHRTKVFWVEKYANRVFTQNLSVKGSDASNIHDEEVADAEIEFSDDEAEAEHKRRLKEAKQSTRGGRQTSNDGIPKAAQYGRVHNPRQDIGPSQTQDSSTMNYDDELYTPLPRPSDLHHAASQGEAPVEVLSTPYTAGRGSHPSRPQRNRVWDRGYRGQSRADHGRGARGSFDHRSHSGPAAHLRGNPFRPPTWSEGRTVGTGTPRYGPNFVQNSSLYSPAALPLQSTPVQTPSTYSQAPLPEQAASAHTSGPYAHTSMPLQINSGPYPALFDPQTSPPQQLSPVYPVGSFTQPYLPQQTAPGHSSYSQESLPLQNVSNWSFGSYGQTHLPTHYPSQPYQLQSPAQSPYTISHNTSQSPASSVPFQYPGPLPVSQSPTTSLPFQYPSSLTASQSPTTSLPFQYPSPLPPSIPPGAHINPAFFSTKNSRNSAFTQNTPFSAPQMLQPEPQPQPLASSQALSPDRYSSPSNSAANLDIAAEVEETQRRLDVLKDLDRLTNYENPPGLDKAFQALSDRLKELEALKNSGPPPPPEGGTIF